MERISFSEMTSIMRDASKQGKEMRAVIVYKQDNWGLRKYQRMTQRKGSLNMNLLTSLTDLNGTLTMGHSSSKVTMTSGHYVNYLRHFPS